MSDSGALNIGNPSRGSEGTTARTQTPIPYPSATVNLGHKRCSDKPHLITVRRSQDKIISLNARLRHGQESLARPSPTIDGTVKFQNLHSGRYLRFANIHSATVLPSLEATHEPITQNLLHSSTQYLSPIPTQAQTVSLSEQRATSYKMGGTAITPEMLENARNESLRKISYRIREKEKDATASPTALGIARQNRPSRSHRKHRPEQQIWENDVPHNDTESPWDDQAVSDSCNAEENHTKATDGWNGVNISDQPVQVTQKRKNYDISRPAYTQPTPNLNQRQVIANTLKHDQAAPADTYNQNDITIPVPVKKLEDSRWASKAELQPIKADLDYNSNAWGSEIPSDASQASGDSLRMMHSGKAIHREPQEAGHDLVGWDGKMAPPPVDWQDRPRYSNNINPYFREYTARWATDVEEWRTSDEYGAPIPANVVMNLNWHPDGIGMVKRTFTIDVNSARTIYGYEDSAVDATKYVQPIQEQAFGDWGKLDPDKQMNKSFGTETTDQLVSNWLENTKNSRKLAEHEFREKQVAKAAMPEYKAPTDNFQPKVNIYVRPAVGVDAEQLLDIYNWYIEHSPRPSEIRPVDLDNLLYRISDCLSNKLPFIVAVMKDKGSSTTIDRTADFEAWKTDPHPIKNVDPSSGVMIKREKIVGWASSSDFTASDYVERIASELEIYVDPGYRRNGIGSCLMDKMLEILDRGYIKRGGYPFHCAPELRQMHVGGGVRDIHKILFTLRKWKQPNDSNGLPIRNAGGIQSKKAKKVDKVDDRENDYEVWLKDWLESCGFRVEGTLIGIGAKNRRFIDTVFMGRETSWQPMDGQIPDLMPGSC